MHSHLHPGSLLALALGVMLTACGAPALKPVQYPTPPTLPSLEPVSIPKAPATSTATLEEVMPPSIKEEVVAARPIPDLTGKGLTTSGTTAKVELADHGAASVVSGVDGLADQLARRMLRAGYTRFVDARALRALEARQEVSGKDSRLTMSGKLHQVALVGKVPRVDYILSVKRLTAKRIKGKVALPVRVDAAAAKRYLAALRAATAKHHNQLETFNEVHASYQSRFNRARAAAEAQHKDLEPEDRAKLNARYDEARLQYSRFTSQLGQARARLAVKLPDHRAEAERLAKRTREVDSEASFCGALLTVMDAATGETLAALSYTARAPSGSTAMDQILDALVKRLLTRTPGMKFPQVKPVAASEGGV